MNEDNNTNNDELIEKILEEVKSEQHPIEDDETLKLYIRDAEYDINENVGIKINYEKDLKARKLLKMYVLYDRYKKLAEFKVIYLGEYCDLQAKYYSDSNIQ